MNDLVITVVKKPGGNYRSIIPVIPGPGHGTSMRQIAQEARSQLGEFTIIFRARKISTSPCSKSVTCIMKSWRP
jgi:hypothetical protein